MVLAASELCSENAFPRTVAAIRRVTLITAQRAIAARLCSALRLGYTAVTAYALAGTELPDLWSSDTHRSRGAYSHTIACLLTIPSPHCQTTSHGNSENN